MGDNFLDLEKYYQKSDVGENFPSWRNRIRSFLSEKIFPSQKNSIKNLSLKKFHKMEKWERVRQLAKREAVGSNPIQGDISMLSFLT